MVFNRIALLLLLCLAFSTPASATRFHRLVRDNNIAGVVKALIKKDVVNSLDNDGRPPLYYAILRGHEEMTRLLLAQGPDLEWEDRNGNGLLHLAAAHSGNKSGAMILAMLLDAGADAFKKNKAGETVSDAALNTGNAVLSVYLAGLTAGKISLSVEVMGVANSELFAAAGAGDLEGVSAALASGADPTRVFDGMSAAEIACAHGHVDVMRHLYKLGAPGVDEALIDAKVAFDEAARLRKEAAEANEGLPFILQGRHEVESLKKCIDNLFKSKHLTTKSRKMLFKSFGRLLQLHSNPPACMLCHRAGKIAGSHYISDAILSFVSSHWVVPGSTKTFSAGAMTLPLFCTNSKKGNKRCEQLLSEQGENDLGKSLLPFITQVIEGRALNANSEHALEYDTWLFHCISSLAFRIFLSDLENGENWLTRLESDPMLVAGGEPILNFVEGLRQYILGEAAPTHNIRLYLSEAGLTGNNELPLITNIGLSFEKTWKVRILFSIRGFHFVLTSNDLQEPELRKMMKLPKHAFVTDILPTGGRIDIKSHHIAVLPKCLNRDIAANTKHQMNELGNMNHDFISETVKKMKIDVSGFDTKLDKIFSLPRYRVMLPDYLRFNSAEEGSDFRPGKLQSTNDAVVLKHYAEFLEEKTACWVFEHTKAKLHFSVIQFGGDSVDVVMAWQFDEKKLTSDLLMQTLLTQDFTELMKTMSVLKGTDHFGVELGDPTAPAAALAATMMKDSNPPALVEEYDFSVEDETLAHRESIKEIRHVMNHDGQIVPCTVVACEPDGNCGFSALKITRGDFIARVVAAYRAEVDPGLTQLIETAMMELGVATIEEWARAFDDRGHWMGFLHLRIASFLYGLRIRVYIVPARNMIPAGVRGDVLIPLPEMAQHVIDETNLANPEEANVVWTTMRPLDEQGHAVLNHFDRIEFAEPAEVGAPVPEVQIFDMPALAKAINVAMMYAFFLQQKGKIPYD